MIKEIISWTLAVVAVFTAFTIAGFAAGVTYGILKSAFELGSLLWH